ncbi:MAG TPA: hypothetical protein VJ111_18790, partial [Chitinophagaceae bacterium]|nr:hypothetical protein [Chitinophagaceae bacterium]
MFLHRGFYSFKRNVVASDSFSWHRLLRRTLQGSVRYPASSLFLFSHGKGTVLHYNPKQYIYHIIFISL